MSNPFVPGGGQSSGPAVEGGLHPAVLVGLFDIGTHVDPEFGKARKKYVLQWELPDAPPVKREGQPEEPRCLSRTFTASMHPKGQLRPLVESWFGKSFPSDEAANTFDVSKLLGRACQINVVHQVRGDKTFANIATVLPAPKGAVIKAKSETIAFTVSQLTHTDDLKVAELPEWIEKKVILSEEWKKLSSGGEEFPASEASQSQPDPEDPFA